MKIIKRSGQEVEFDSSKIYNAITKANNNQEKDIDRISEAEIREIVDNVTKKCKSIKRAVSVEEIQDMVDIVMKKITM